MSNRSSLFFATTLVVAALPFSLGAAAQTVPGNASPARAAIAEDYGKLPLSFEANRGQTDLQVRFTSRGDGYSLFLTDTEAVLSLSKPSAGAGKGRRLRSGSKKSGARAIESTKTDVVRMQLAGSNRNPNVAGDDQLPGTANYFIGNDPAKWHASVPTYGRVKYSGVYDGIDLVYYGNQRQLEYDFVVAPQADPGLIRLHFEGADGLRLTQRGDLSVSTAQGNLTLRKPVLYQSYEGRRIPVRGAFKVAANHTVTFAVGKYDRDRSLIVDPILSYSTFLGGSLGTNGEGIAVDSSGSAYVTGATEDTNFPVTSGVVQSTNAGGADVSNVFVTKLNAAGTALVYSTYIGGSGDADGDGDFGLAIAVDSTGDSYITGYTYSSDFPVLSPYQSANHGAGSNFRNGFVSKLNATGTALVYSTYLGGTGEPNEGGDNGLGIAVNSAGNAFVVGTAASADFPVSSGAYQTSNKGVSNKASNAFVTEFDASGSRLVYSTLLGGQGITQSGPCCKTSGDDARGIAVDSAGNAYVSGVASSTDFPVTSGALQATNAGAANHASNGFVAKINPTGTALIYSTYLGGSSLASNLPCFGCNFGDVVGELAIDAAGDAFVAGATFSANFPTTTGAFQTVNHSAANSVPTGFVSEINPTGTALIYSTLLGGTSMVGDIVYGIAINSAGNAFVSGYTGSADFPVTSDAFQSTNKAASNQAPSAFVTELNLTGTGLVYSSFLGGSGLSGLYNGQGSMINGYEGDYAMGIALDGSGNAYVAGVVSSPDFPVTTGAFDTARTGGAEGFVAKVIPGTPPASIATSTTIASSANPQTAGVPITFTAQVKANSGTTIPSGYVDFIVAGDVSHYITLDNTGHGSFTTTMVTGSHVVQANYLGTLTYAGSTASLTETITAPPAATPMFTPVAGTYVGTQMVTISDTTPSSTIYYTLNGTTPTTSSTKYTAAIAVAVSGTIKAIATAANYSSSAVGSAAYIIHGAAAVPTFVPAGGTYLTPQTVTLGDATTGATIYYTTDKSTPTTSSAVYSAGIAVAANETIRAFAVVSGYVNSAVATASYVIDPELGAISTFAGDGMAAESGVGVPATGAAMNGPFGAIFDGAGDLLVSDYGGNTIRKITAGGTITTIAGTGTKGFNGDNQPATSAELGHPQGMAYDTAGNLYIAEGSNARVRKIALDGTISTYAGNGTQGYSGDGGPATSAEIKGIGGVVFDLAGNLYIADYSNNRVRKVDTAGIITTFVGNGTAGYMGDTGSAMDAEMNGPQDLAFDSAGDLLIADQNNNVVRKVTPGGIISTYAGNGTAAYMGDGGQATKAEMNQPNGLRFDSLGNLFIADLGNNVIRKVTAAGVISTVAGDGTQGFLGDGGPATEAEIFWPSGVAFDLKANLYLTDLGNNRVRKITYPLTPTPTFSPAPGTYTTGQIVTLTDATLGAAIHYTTDNSTPTLASPVYTTPLKINASTNVKAVAVAASHSVSAGATASYAIHLPSDATPTFNPACGTYTSALSVTLASTTAGAVFYYTTDGTTPTTASTKYAGRIVVPGTETIEAIAISTGHLASPVASCKFNIHLPAATPTFSPVGGSYTTIQTVTLSSTTPGAAIYYTLTGATPTVMSARYTAPIEVSKSTVIKAVAIASGYSLSAVGSANYVVHLPVAATPTFTPVAGTYTGPQNINLVDATPGAVLYYTTNGSTPTVSSTQYTAAIPISATSTIKAIAIAPNYANSAVASALYHIP